MGVRVLGPARVDGARALGARDRRVLAALVVLDGRVCAPDRIADALYGDAPPPTWRKVVQGSVVRLRRVLGAHAIETSSAGYRLALGGDDVDARRFERLVREAEHLAEVGDAERSASVLADALALFADDALVDLDDWEPARAEAARLAELRLVAQERRVEALLASGQHRDAATLAAALVEEQPLREQRWAALALAQYRSGRQAEALRSLQRARRLLVDELGVDPGPELVALERSILEQDPSLVAPATPPVARRDCPYRGLEGYDVADADEFFGRERAVNDCLRRLSMAGGVVIVGPSGCGKSSLARAGVAAALARRGAQLAIVTPGARPGATLDAVAAGTTVVVDQVEELWTQCDDLTERARFVAELTARAAIAPVVLTLRADHLASAAELADLAELVERGIYLLRPMGEDDLRSAIEGPATRAGLRLEAGLVDLLVRDVVDQPGALPLLSHALTQLWAERDGRVLTVAAYRAIGGVQGAVGRTAEQAIERLTPDGRRIARALFLRLVTTADGEPAGHRLARREIAADAEHAGVVEVLARARLITVDDASVQLAHEALARAWPRLRAWLDEDREGQRILLHLGAAAAGWVALGRPRDELYRGARLHAAEEWVAAARPTLTPPEREFLAESAEARDQEQADLRTIATARARQNRRLRRFLAAAAVLLVVAVATSTFAFVERDHAAHARVLAQRDAHAAALRDVVSRAAALRGTQRDVAALLALAAYRIAPSTDTYSALLSTFTTSGSFERTVDLPLTSAIGALLPDGQTYAALDAQQGVHLLRLADGREVARLPGAQATAASYGVIAVAPRGDAVAVASEEPGRSNVLSVWDLATRRRRFPDVTLPFPPGSVAFSADGALVAVGGGLQGDVQVRRASDGRLVSAVAGLPRADGAHLHVDTAALAFVRGGRLLIASQNGPSRVVDPATGRVLRTIAGAPEMASVFLTVASDGTSAYGSGFRGISKIDVATERVVWQQADGAQCDSIALAAAIDALLCSRSGNVLVFDATTGVLRSEGFAYQHGLATTLAVTHTGAELIEGGADRLAFWRLDGGGAIRHVVPGSAGLLVKEFEPDGALMLALHEPAGPPTAPRLVDATTGRVIDPLTGARSATGAGQPRGRVALVVGDTTIAVEDIGRRTRVAGATVHLPFEVDGVTALGRELVAYSDTRMQGITLDGRLVAPAATRPAGSGDMVGTTDGSRLFSIESGALVTRDRDGRRLHIPTIANVAGVAASREGLLVATGDGRVREYDPRTMAVRHDLPTAGGVVIWLAVADAAHRFAGVVSDGTIRLADETTEAYLGEPFGAAAEDVASNTTFDVSTVLALGARGDTLAYATARGVIAWDFAPATLAAAACRVAGRDITAAEWHTYLAGLAPRRQLCAAR